MSIKPKVFEDVKKLMENKARKIRQSLSKNKVLNA
jgi:hypothetical protein